MSCYWRYRASAVRVFYCCLRCVLRAPASRPAGPGRNGSMPPPVIASCGSRPKPARGRCISTRTASRPTGASCSSRSRPASPPSKSRRASNTLLVAGKVRALFVGRRTGLVYFSKQRGAGDSAQQTPTAIYTVPATGGKPQAHRAHRTRLHRLGQRRRDPVVRRVRGARLAARTGPARSAFRCQLRGHGQRTASR